MPSKASMLMLIARAARSVATAAGRFARVAKQAAALPPKAEAMAAIPLAMDAPNHQVDGWIGPGIPSKDFVGKPKVKFVAQEKDLESDEALWGLYERSCKAFNQKRDHDEMVRWFQKFKDIVLRVHRTNNVNLSYTLAINKFADGKLIEKVRNCDNRDAMLMEKAGNSCFIVRPEDKILRQVMAHFKVVNGKLFVYTKCGKGRIDLLELNVEYEVVDGKLFVDLPAGHELVVLNEDFLMRGMCW